VVSSTFSTPLPGRTASARSIRVRRDADGNVTKEVWRVELDDPGVRLVNDREDLWGPVEHEPTRGSCRWPSTRHATYY
jgi:hypothetical protein